MVKQYVGARYVPKFASPVEWAADTSYEALTIVTFNNASYTSKVPVPPTVGNPANNPQYWALTGNYNAQVEQYRQVTETVSNNLATEITNLKNDDTALQGKINAEITNRETAVATLQDNLDAEAASRQTANNILQGNINSEAATRASADSNLQSQINQIVAPSGEAPSAAEVQNARIGVDGVTYDTLGTAIRTQVNDLATLLEFSTDSKEKTLWDMNDYPGWANTSNNVIHVYDTYVPKGDYIYSITLQPQTGYHNNGNVYLLEKQTDTQYKVVKKFEHIKNGYVKLNYLCSDNTYIAIQGEYLTRITQDTGFIKMKQVNDSFGDAVDALGYSLTSKLVIYTHDVTYEVGENEEYTNLIDAINKALLHSNSVVNIHKGTYDITNLIPTLDTLDHVGIYLFNGITLNFLPGSRVVCNYTGTRTFTRTQFSIFNANTQAQNKSFTINGLNAEASNIRYIIHDDLSYSKGGYEHTYKNCNLSFDNSNNTDFDTMQCIGGGFGENGIVNISNCVFNTVKRNNTQLDVSYHNDGGGGVSKMYFNNNYLSGTFRLSSYGSQTDKTICVCCNNSFNTEPISNFEGDATVKNTELVSYCNEIRGN